MERKTLDIYQHFRKEEAPFIDTCIDKCLQAERNYAPVLTHFLDPRGQYILEVITGSYQDLKVYFEGGRDSERKRALITPDYYEPQIDDFELSLIDIDYPKKFVTIQHQHILGTLMSLGIEREQIGDILVGDRLQFVLTKQLESFIMFELTRIRNASIKLNSIPLEDMIQSKENWKVQTATVSAMRLDVVLKDMIRKSRGIAKALIEKKRVKVNHTIIEDVAFKLDEGDLLSIQGYGRAKVTEIGHRTKKDKLHITYETMFK
ncbi:RNA-binding protein [Staphylococcus massiliensis]|uniref:YlmH family RNA-binding protein n=1 Tax=Staphylococcus massiliensis TaxID=555791 RepID=UPI00068FAF32|nr:RNA-binding protein [Staphylococcus massiliensis]MCG3398841.1 RNA-binding protein [Staphylococcus massiliensis]MCG3401402.1 RNA-binding protein [Staphylococcus massiliensis]MCG3411816.1 RNA-binding protein [Staphylococcus massiliensis]